MKKLLAILAVCHPAPILADGVIERLEQLESRLALLERQIIASPTGCDTLGPGWTRFKGATGRFLMGDDGDSNINEIGGGPSATLTTDNLAAHSHDVTNLRRAYDEATVDGFMPGHAFGDGDAPGRVVVLGSPLNYRVVTEKQGSATPFSILPPFLEIHFCTKSE